MLLRIRTQAVQTTLAESIALAPPEFLQCTSVGTFVSTASHSDQLYVGSPLETWFISSPAPLHAKTIQQKDKIFMKSAS
jgi:hypothetical protein